MDKDFFMKWRGAIVDPLPRNQWRSATGSSLANRERNILAKGRFVLHEKPQTVFNGRPQKQFKVFAQDADGSLWSVIVSEEELTALKDDWNRAQQPQVKK